MMKNFFTIFTLVALLLFTVESEAKQKSVTPGIYSLNGETLVPLNFSYSTTSVEGKNVMGVEVSYETYKYKGESSGVEASGSFILVTNPKKWEVEKKFKKYDPFVRNLKPTKLIIVPLTVNSEQKYREYYLGMKLQGMNAQSRTEMKFDWEELSDNIYRIDVQYLVPGEYAIIFTDSRLLGPDFSAIYGFTITDTPPLAGYSQDFSLDVSDTPEPPSLMKNGYIKTNWEVRFGYVNKSWICDYGSGAQREDYFGDTDAKFMHGVQIGALYTPSFNWGLGLRTGLLLEVYESKREWITAWCDKFSEGNLSIPLHASYRIPFNEFTAITFYGGAAFQWVIQGRFENYVYSPTWRRRTETVGSPEYGNGWPKRVNWQAETGLNFRYKTIGLNFTYAFGLVDHEIENTFDGGQTFVKAQKSRQDKMQASFILIF